MQNDTFVLTFFDSRLNRRFVDESVLFYESASVYELILVYGQISVGLRRNQHGNIVRDTIPNQVVLKTGRSRHCNFVFYVNFLDHCFDFSNLSDSYTHPLTNGLERNGFSGPS